MGSSNKRTFSLPPPMLDFRIVLEARNPGRRCLRQYRVEAGTDLSASGSSRSTTAASAPPGGRGALSSATKWRPGCSPGASSGARAGGAGRIGVPYRIRELIDPQGGLATALEEQEHVSIEPGGRRI